MDALTRYYAATNVAMLLPKEPEVIKEAITDFCAVTDEKKKRVARTLAARREQWPGIVRVRAVRPKGFELSVRADARCRATQFL